MAARGLLSAAAPSARGGSREGDAEGGPEAACWLCTVLPSLPPGGGESCEARPAPAP